MLVDIPIRFCFTLSSYQALRYLQTCLKLSPFVKIEVPYPLICNTQLRFFYIPFLPWATSPVTAFCLVVGQDDITPAIHTCLTVLYPVEYRSTVVMGRSDPPELVPAGISGLSVGSSKCPTRKQMKVNPLHKDNFTNKTVMKKRVNHSTDSMTFCIRFI